MPELPEVETIARGLRKKILHRPIVDIRVRCRRIVVSKIPLLTLLKNDRFISIGRHGKYLLFTTKKRTRLVVHLRMTGQLFTANTLFKPDKHTHIVLTFKDGGRLVYRDVRTFGRWTVVQPGKGFMDYINAGPDALSISLDEITQAVEKRPRMKLKAFLLHQPVIAGIGNIYADETCHMLKLDPESAVSSVEPSKLKQAFQKILQLAIKNKGTTVSDYLTSYRARGNFQDLLNVYGQETCRKCGTKIIRKKVAGRTSHVCPQCQK